MQYIFHQAPAGDPTDYVEVEGSDWDAMAFELLQKLEQKGVQHGQAPKSLKTHVHVANSKVFKGFPTFFLYE